MKRKIMIIDDAPEIREILKMALETEGYEVIHAVHGQDGIDQLTDLEKDSHPHLILLDLMMPIMDGHKFLETLDNKELLREIPVIVMTAKVGPVFNSVILPKAVLTKPVDLDLLLSSISANLSIV